MRPRNNASRRPWLAVLAALLASAVGGCYDYLDRSNSVTLGVADATDTNKAVQTINRWPPAARNDRWESDGERARIAVERYRERKVPDPLKPENKSTDAAPGASAGAAKN